MKKLNLSLNILIILIISSTISYSQTDKINSDDSFNSYLDFYRDKNVQGVLDITPNFIFENIEQDSVRKWLNASFSDEELIVYYDQASNIKIHSIGDHKGEKYFIGNYTVPIEIPFGQSNEESADEYQEVVQWMTVVFKNQFGENNVSFKEDLQYFDINAEIKVLGMTEDKKEVLKFIEIGWSEKVDALLTKKLPNKIKKKL